MEIMEGNKQKGVYRIPLKKKGEGGGHFLRKFHKFRGDSIRDLTLEVVYPTFLIKGRLTIPKRSRSQNW